MSDSKAPDNSLPKQEAAVGLERVAGGRRRLLAGALAAAPVVAVLRSRDVLANGVCPSVSAFLSANAGSNRVGGTQCGGRTPGYWQTNALPGDSHPWPAPYTPGTCAVVPPGNGQCKDFNGDGTKMADPSNGFVGVGCAPYATATMMQVLQMGGNQDPYQAGAHLVAALLNLAKGWYGAPPLLSKADIIEMGQAVLCGGLYQAAPGVSWNAQQVVTYLKTTMDPYSWSP